MCHLTDDYKRFGPLDNYSCFKFENFLRHVKKTVHLPKNPLQQLINCVYETDQSLNKATYIENKQIVLMNKVTVNDELLAKFNLISFYCVCYSKIALDNGKCVLQNDYSNKFVFLKNNKPFVIHFFVRDIDGNLFNKIYLIICL